MTKRHAASRSFRWPAQAKVRVWRCNGPQLSSCALRNLDLADYLMLGHEQDRRTVDLEVLLVSLVDPLGHANADWIRWRIRYDFLFEGYQVRLTPRAPRSRGHACTVLCWRLSIWTP